MRKAFEKVIRGYFEQELHVGDVIAFVSKSCGMSGMNICRIHSIEFLDRTRKIRNWETQEVIYEPYFEPIVKISKIDLNYRKWNGEIIEKRYIKRIYNWDSAITLKPANQIDNFSLDNYLALNYGDN